MIGVLLSFWPGQRGAYGPGSRQCQLDVAYVGRWAYRTRVPLYALSRLREPLALNLRSLNGERRIEDRWFCCLCGSLQGQSQLSNAIDQARSIKRRGKRGGMEDMNIEIFQITALPVTAWAQVTYVGQVLASGSLPSSAGLPMTRSSAHSSLSKIELAVSPVW